MKKRTMTQQAEPIPDENLREVILSVFAADSRTASEDLRVGVLNGIAHLAGTVDSISNTICGRNVSKTNYWNSRGG